MGSIEEPPGIFYLGGPEHPEDKNSIYQRLRWHFCRITEQTSEFRHMKMEIDIGLPLNNLTQRSDVYRGEQRAKDRAL